MDIGCSIHGGLTYGANHAPSFEPDGYWWLGFDCNHSGDTQDNRPETYVRAEVGSLRQQALDAFDIDKANLRS